MSELSELQREIEEVKKENARESNLKKFLKSEGADKYPIELLKVLITHDEAESKKNIELLKGLGNTSYKAPKHNPWDKKHFNLTKQAEIIKEDPKLAERLKDEAE